MIVFTAYFGARDIKSEINSSSSSRIKYSLRFGDPESQTRSSPSIVWIKYFWWITTEPLLYDASYVSFWSYELALEVRRFRIYAPAPAKSRLAR